MAGWHHWLDGCESEWTPGVGDGQGGLACCDSWGCKESDTTEWLNWTELNQLSFNNLHQFIVHKSDCFSDFFSYQYLILLIFLISANLMGKNTILYFLASLWSWASLLHLLAKHEYVFNNKLFVYSLCPFFFFNSIYPFFDFPGGSVVKKPPASRNSRK